MRMVVMAVMQMRQHVTERLRGACQPVNKFKRVRERFFACGLSIFWVDAVRGQFGIYLTRYRVEITAEVLVVTDSCRPLQPGM